MSTRLMRFAGLFGVGALVLTSCGNDADAGDESDEEYDIAVVLKTTTSPYWLQVMGGVDDGAEELGSNVTIGGATQESEVQEQIDRINTDLTRSLTPWWSRRRRPSSWSRCFRVRPTKAFRWSWWTPAFPAGTGPRPSSAPTTSISAVPSGSSSWRSATRRDARDPRSSRKPIDR